jgi:hypothetical protein
MNAAEGRGRLGDTALTVLAIAIVARVVWELLAPLVPLLVGLVVSGVIVAWVFRNR